MRRHFLLKIRSRISVSTHTPATSAAMAVPTFKATANSIDCHPTVRPPLLSPRRIHFYHCLSSFHPRNHPPHSTFQNYYTCQQLFFSALLRQCWPAVGFLIAVPEKRVFTKSSIFEIGMVAGVGRKARDTPLRADNPLVNIQHSSDKNTNIYWIQDSYFSGGGKTGLTVKRCIKEIVLASQDRLFPLSTQSVCSRPSFAHH